LIAEAVAAEATNVEAAPVIDRRRDRRLDREVGRDRRRPQSQRTERGAGKKDTLPH